MSREDVCAKPGCGRCRWDRNHASGGHAFVEPRAEAPQGETAKVHSSPAARAWVEAAAQPETGDEEKCHNAPKGCSFAVGHPGACRMCLICAPGGAICRCHEGDEGQVRDDGQGLHPITAKWVDAATELGEGIHAGVIDGAVREALRDGRAAENEACEKLVRARADVAYHIAEHSSKSRKALHGAADAIAARRGGGR